MNSLYCSNPNLSKAALMKYSTALTSWFVVFSVSFIQSASSVEKFSYISRNFGYRFLSTPANCGKGNSHKAIKYSISTNTRYLIRASSEKKGEREMVLFLYRPSIGDMAFNSFKVVIVILFVRKGA